MERDVKSTIVNILMILLFIGAIVIVFNVINPPFTESKFEIYKKECRNETIENSYTWNDFNMIDCPKDISETECYDNKGNIIKDLICQRTDIFCYFSEEYGVYILEEDYSSFLYPLTIYNNEFVSPINFAYSITDFIKNKSIGEVCEKGEMVDSINSLDFKYTKINKEEITNRGEGYNFFVTINGDTENWETFTLCNEENGEIFCEDTFGEYKKKSDLTTSWLDENCECSGCYDMGWSFIFENRCVYPEGTEINGKLVNEEYVDYCLEYKCGDYFVEVR